MEAQVHGEESQDVNMNVGEEAQKKSVNQKVRDEAKKLKESQGKKDHNHSSSSDDGHEYGGQGEEEEKEEKNEKDPEIHGAPMYESSRVAEIVKGEDEGSTEMQKSGFGAGESFEKDPNMPTDRSGVYSPENYEAKVDDPTSEGGGEEAEVAPLVRNFGGMGISSEQNMESEKPKESVEHFSEESLQNPTGKEQVESPKQQNYIEKISSVTSTIASKAVQTKDAVISRLGQGTCTRETTEGISAQPSAAAKIEEYGRKIAEKVGNVGTSAVSKTKEIVTGGESGYDKGVSIKSFLFEKLRPGEEDRALSEVISEVMHRKKEETGASEKAETSSEMIENHIGGKGMTNKVKGAITSFFGKGENMKHIQSQAQGQMDVADTKEEDKKTKTTENVE